MKSFFGDHLQIPLNPYVEMGTVSGYKETLIYQKDLPPSNKARQRKIMNVETNIEKNFLKLIEKHFPKTGSTKYSTETMSKLPTVVSLILPT